MQKNKLLSAILGLAILATLVGCASKNTGPEDNGMLPIIDIGDQYDLDNSHAQSALKTYLKNQGLPIFAQYKIMRTDLNGDGRREALMHITSPYGHWCSERGCSVLIFKENKTEFTPVGTLKNIRNPIYISTNTTQGWKDIILRASGELDKKAQNIRIQYNGRQYIQSAYDKPRYNGNIHDIYLKAFP